MSLLLLYLHWLHTCWKTLSSCWLGPTGRMMLGKFLSAIAWVEALYCLAMPITLHDIARLPELLFGSAGPSTHAAAALTKVMQIGGSMPMMANKAAGRAQRPSPAMSHVAAAGRSWAAWLPPPSIQACFTRLPTQKSTAMNAPTAQAHRHAQRERGAAARAACSDMLAFVHASTSCKIILQIKML